MSFLTIFRIKLSMNRIKIENRTESNKKFLLLAIYINRQKNSSK